MPHLFNCSHISHTQVFILILSLAGIYEAAFNLQSWRIEGSISQMYK